LKGGKKMKIKKGKIFGIGIVTLFVMLALAPVAQPKIENIYHIQNVPVIPNPQQIQARLNQILQNHQTDINLIAEYLNNYIAQYGSLPDNFTFPADLQQKFDAITNDVETLLDSIQGYQFIQEPTELQQSEQIGRLGFPEGGGINRAQGPFPYTKWLPPEFGIYWKVWMNDALCKAVEVGAHTWSLLQLLLLDLGPVGIFIDIILTAISVEIALVNQGNGVQFNIYFSFWHLPFLPQIYTDNMVPQ
jgi:hypothetical protein